MDKRQKKMYRKRNLCKTMVVLTIHGHFSTTITVKLEN